MPTDETEREHVLRDFAKLRIECPICRRTADSVRDELDPPEAVKALILCPDCVGGDFGETTYLNAAGETLLPGPDGYHTGKDAPQ